MSAPALADPEAPGDAPAAAEGDAIGSVAADAAGASAASAVDGPSSGPPSDLFTFTVAAEPPLPCLADRDTRDSLKKWYVVGGGLTVLRIV